MTDPATTNFGRVTKWYNFCEQRCQFKKVRRVWSVGRMSTPQSTAPEPLCKLCRSHEGLPTPPGCCFWLAVTRLSPFTCSVSTALAPADELFASVETDKCARDDKQNWSKVSDRKRYQPLPPNNNNKISTTKPPFPSQSSSTQSRCRGRWLGIGQYCNCKYSGGTYDMGYSLGTTPETSPLRR